MDVQQILNLLIMVVMAVVGFFAKQVHGKADDTQKDLSAFKQHVAENYAHNGRIDEIKEAMSTANRRLDTIYELLTREKR